MAAGGHGLIKEIGTGFLSPAEHQRGFQSPTFSDRQHVFGICILLTAGKAVGCC